MVETLSSLTTDLKSVEFQHGVDQRFWRLVDRSDHLVYVELFAPDNRPYMLELDCRNYGDDAIAGRFVDPSTRKCVQTAWPTGNQTFLQWVKFNGGFFICWDQDRNAISRHPHWKNQQEWKKVPNQIVAYLDFIRRLLHLPSRGYARRN